MKNAIFNWSGGKDSSLALYHILKENNFNKKIEFHPNMWKIYNDKDINLKFKKYVDKINIINYDVDFITNKLINNKIIGVFNWGSEFGPRALWHRSILSSPINKINNYRTNVIKSREKWRPLAPIILEEDFSKYLEENFNSPYMTLSSKVKKDELNNIKGVVHIDNTVRYQTVNSNSNELIYNILKNFKEKTGVSVLINTSLNVKTEPIVETPNEAIRLFLSTDLDYLIIWKYILEKKQKYLEYKFDYDNNLFTILFDDVYERKTYLIIREYLEKIFFKNMDIGFSFIKKYKCSYILEINNIKVNINFLYFQNNSNLWYYFKHKNISYNFSWNNIVFDSNLDTILKKINYIIINNYSNLLPLFLKLNNYDN